MKAWKGSVLGMIALIVSLLAMLSLLAVLQYRWTGQVGEAELERLRARLRADANQFKNDFDAEVARTYMTFLVRPDGEWEPGRGKTQDWIAREYSERLERWASSSAHSKLVRDLFWVDRDAAGRLKIASFDRETGKLLPAEWPEELERWHLAFQERLAGRRPRQPGGPAQLIVEAAPAIVIPVMQARRFFPVPGPPAPAFLGFCLVRLDRAYMTKEMLPSMAARYFAAADGPGGYDVTVVNRSNPRTVVFASNPRLEQQSTQSADVEMSFFGLRAEAFRLAGGAARAWRAGTRGSRSWRTGTQRWRTKRRWTARGWAGRWRTPGATTGGAGLWPAGIRRTGPGESRAGRRRTPTRPFFRRASATGA